MKKDWLHIKFADAFVLNMGKTPARAEASYWTDGIYPWVSISDLSGDKFITHTKEQISQKAVNETNIHLVPKGTVIMSFKLSIGKTAIAPFDLYTNEAIMAFEPKPEISVVPDFLYYYLQYYKWSGNRAVMGETINKAVISNSYADIPPLSIQRSIVAELDLLHSVISKKKEQLRELDNLAQSLFYQMFGDPITNPMGWEIKKLGEVVAEDCSLSYGIVQPGDHVENGIPVVRPIDLTDTYVFRKGLKCTSEEIASAYKRTVLRGNELLMCVRGTTGVVSIASSELVGCNTTRGITPIALGEKVSLWFVYHLLKMSSYQQLIASLTYGIALKQINMKDVRTLPIILPPLSLQQSFAAKVSAIEAQKQAITQSIHHTEALLAQRMDQYFG